MLQALVDSGVNCKYKVVPELDHFNIIDNLQFDDYKLTVVSSCVVTNKLCVGGKFQNAATLLDANFKTHSQLCMYVYNNVYTVASVHTVLQLCVATYKLQLQFVQYSYMYLAKNIYKFSYSYDLNQNTPGVKKVAAKNLKKAWMKKM